MKFIFQQNDQEGYAEEPKNYLWNGGPQPYEQYTDHQQSVIYAPSTPQIPATVDYAGQLDFDILITSQTASRNSWIVSTQKYILTLKKNVNHK